jgi:uncharacterized membrane protein
MEEEDSLADSAAGAVVLAEAAREEAGNMKHHSFLKKLDAHRIIGAIHRVEQETSSQIQLFISSRKTEDPIASAQKRFHALGMDKLPGRNSVLIFVAPKSKKFAVIGDKAVHEKCGQTFWDELAALMTGHFKRGEFTLGAVAAIERAGKLLAHHFPKKIAGNK